MPTTIPQDCPTKVVTRAAVADGAGPDLDGLPTPAAPRGFLARQVHAFAADFWAQMLTPPGPVREAAAACRGSAME